MAYRNSTTFYQGTIKSWPSFNAKSDCEALKKAMDGYGYDGKGVIDILCNRSNAQRQQIRQTFQSTYDEDVIKTLTSELRGDFEHLIISLMYTPAEYDARELRHAMIGGFTESDSTLIEIMASRTNSEIREIRTAYRTMFGNDLEYDLVNHTSGYFGRLLLILYNASRSESTSVDLVGAKKTAQDLSQDPAKRTGTDESAFITVLCSQNSAQLQAIFDEYKKLTNTDIEQDIKNKFCGNFADGLLAIVKSTRNPPAYFAERAYRSMAGLGTHDRSLIRVIVTRCEKDMVQIKSEFQRLYGKSLENWIMDDTSGKYKDGLIALVRGNSAVPPNPTPYPKPNHKPNIVAIEYQGTVQSSPSFNAKSDCEALKKAMQGVGCDDRTVMNILCYRSNNQRQQIRQLYKSAYGKDLITELISELHGNFEDLIKALMYLPTEYDAQQLHQAMYGGFTKSDSTLIEIMATRSNADIVDIRKVYRILFDKELEHSFVKRTSGSFSRLLVSLCNTTRDESTLVNQARAKKSAQDLIQGGDESAFTAILSAQSYAQLRAVFDEYKNSTQKDIEQAIKDKFKGDVEDLFLAIVKNVKNPPAYFAEQAHRFMAGAGTHDRCLIRVIVTRCEKDMVQIKQEFQRLYGKSLENWIQGDTSGKYKDGLLALIGGGTSEKKI